MKGANVQSGIKKIKNSGSTSDRKDYLPDSVERILKGKRLSGKRSLQGRINLHQRFA
jgi:hypothetical protein